MNAFCILFSDNNHTSKMGELTANRAIASIPFGGRFRLVDFMLSSLVAGNVSNIGIVAKNNYGSLMDHIGWGKDWDLNRKNGGVKFLTPYIEDADAVIGENKIESLNSIMGFIKNSLPEYCIICDGNIVCSINFEDIMEEHQRVGADITFAYKNMKPCAKELEVFVDENGRLVDTLYHTSDVDKNGNVVLNIMLLKKDLLISLVEQGITYGWTSIKRDVFSRNFNSMNIHGYEVDGYVSVIKDINDYYNTSMSLLNEDVRRAFYYSEIPILTRIKDSVPTIYGDNCSVKNSLIADGCNINGNVENCIIFRDVKIENGAVLKNCIIMQNTVLREGSSLSYVITDKDVEITSGQSLSGSLSMPFIINKGKKV